jgi:hypothetical protein
MMNCSFFFSSLEKPLGDTVSNKEIFEVVYIRHFGWPSGIGLGSGSVILLEVSGSIIPSVNLGGLI